MPEAHSLDGVACFTVRMTGRGLSRSVISNCNHHGPPYEKQHLTQICAGWAPGVKGQAVAEARGASRGHGPPNKVAKKNLVLLILFNPLI